MLTSVEMAVRFGKTLLIQDVDSIHPVVFPLLRHDLINQGTFKKIIFLFSFLNVTEV